MSWHPRTPAVVIVVALAGDLILISASVLHRTVSSDGVLGFLTLGRWDGDKDGTFVEIWGGFHLVLAACVLVLLGSPWWRRAGRSDGVDRPAPVYRAWAVVLMTIAADDYFMIHEHAGALLVDSFGIPAAFGVRGQDLGELLVWASLGAIVGTLLAICHLRSDRRARGDSLVFLALTFFLAGSGVVLDVLNIALYGVVNEPTRTLTMHLETGGELVAMTLLLAWSLRLLDRRRAIGRTPVQDANLLGPIEPARPADPSPSTDRT